MQSPRLNYVNCVSTAGVHRMAYWEWGDPDNDRVLMCVHGLTRTGRDFDDMARAMSGEYRVICPDIVGRGASDFLFNPSLYAVPQYVSDIFTLLARVNPKTLDWIGTSMGGLIGMVFAGLVHKADLSIVNQVPRDENMPAKTGLALNRLVLNDVGPKIELEAIRRIGAYVGNALEFDSLESAVAYMKVNAASFGPLNDRQWLEFTKSVIKFKDNVWKSHYDVRIAQTFKEQESEEALAAAEAYLWRSYTSIDCPILILRGENSDLLSRESVAQMLEQNKNSQMVEIPEVGHAPTLMPNEQIQTVREFLLS